MAYTTTVFNIRYRITLIVSLCRNWYLHSTINKVYLLEYTVHVCIDDALFHFKLELRAFSVAIVLYMYTIKTKTITGRVGVYKQIVGLYVIDNYTFLLISRIL
jgi:hypothetical protein